MEIITPASTGFTKKYQQLDCWYFLFCASTLILLLPLLSISTSLFQPFSDSWQHLFDTVLSSYIYNSLILMIGVAIGTFIIGTSCAWVASMCEFPGRRFFEWALLLPLAMPAYIIAYTYGGMLDFAGPLQSFLRQSFDWRYGDYWFPEIRSIGGAITLFSLVLYPYVYLIARTSFLEQSHALLEVSRSLGNGPWKTFFRVAIPSARPAIVAGITLSLMETLADYGTVQHFGISTFTTGIFRTWFGLGELQTAAQLSSLLMLFVVVLISIERISRKRMRFFHATASNKTLSRTRLSGYQAALAFLLCLMPLLLGFIAPAIQLGIWAEEVWRDNVNLHFLSLVKNTFLLAACSAVSCCILALGLCFANRLHRQSTSAPLILRAATLGYAVPGTVIAVGVLIPFAFFDNTLDNFFSTYFGVSTGLILSGSLFAIIFAYTVRFVSVAVHSVESGYSHIRPSVDDSARLLGTAPSGVLRRVHFPLLRTSLLTALLLVFVEVLKELPTTLILRPFNFNTLAVRAYELASDERLMDASIPALAIVAVGLLPVLLLSRTIGKKK